MSNILENVWNLVVESPALGLVIVFGWVAWFGIIWLIFVSRKQDKRVQMIIGMAMMIVLIMLIPLTVENLFK